MCELWIYRYSIGFCLPGISIHFSCYPNLGLCLGGKSWVQHAFLWPDTPKLCQIARIFPKPFEVLLQAIRSTPPSQLIYVQNFPRVKFQPLIWLGPPRQTESLYNYQPHHHHLMVVNNKNLIGVRCVGQSCWLLIVLLGASWRGI